VGASLAFEAALDRYDLRNYVLLNYHVHIPQPDPMVNPSTLERQKFYGVRSSPSYFIDGDSDGGGGSADGAKSLYDRKVEPVVEKHLGAAPEAAIKLRATQSGSLVKVKADVSGVKSKSDKLRLQVALVEDLVKYSGENGNRLHEMVVRSLANGPPAPAAKPAQPTPAPAPAAGDKPAAAAAPAAGNKPASPPATPPALPTGFALKPGKGGSFEWTFDLTKAAADAKAHLEDFETNTRKGTYTFRQKKHEIDAGNLSVVAFVQDEATKKILQAIYVKMPAPKAGN
jgi:hypothetical protein